MMSTELHKAKNCKFGSSCKRRATCSFSHPEQDYGNSCSYSRYESNYHNTQCPISSHDQYQFDYDSQDAVLLSLNWQDPTNQNFSDYMTAQHPISACSDTNRQQSYLHGNCFQYNEQPNKLQASKKSTNCKTSDSEFEFSKRNNSKQYKTVPSTPMEQLKNEIQILLCVCNIF
jgi:hypothetical protein